MSADVYEKEKGVWVAANIPGETFTSRKKAEEASEAKKKHDTLMSLIEEQLATKLQQETESDLLLK